MTLQSDTMSLVRATTLLVFIMALLPRFGAAQKANPNFPSNTNIPCYWLGAQPDGKLPGGESTTLSGQPRHRTAGLKPTATWAPTSPRTRTALSAGRSRTSFI